MTMPDSPTSVEIPEDVREAGQRLANAVGAGLAFRAGDMIAEALLAERMAERERAAKIADDHTKAKWGGELDANTILRVTAQSIAFSIRSQSNVL